MQNVTPVSVVHVAMKLLTAPLLIAAIQVSSVASFAQATPAVPATQPPPAAPVTRPVPTAPAARPDRPQRETGAAAPAAPAPTPGPRSSLLQRGNAVMLALDTDHNGELSTVEIANSAAALRALDKNGDGKVAGEELRAAPAQVERKVPNPAAAADSVTELMAYDKNGDGKLSAEELPERMRRVITRADADKDGFATKEELTKALTTPGTGSSRFRTNAARATLPPVEQPPAPAEQK